MKIKRKIILIDETKCDGCGLCVPSCHEGAIRVIDGKARVLKESSCDGLGACLGECPRGAITLEEREAEAFAAEIPVKDVGAGKGACGCPGAQAFGFAREEKECRQEEAEETPSELRQWPVQLQLVPVDAPYWRDADILLAADCALAADGGFQKHLLRGRRLIIACPKLDNVEGYIDKLANIFMVNCIRTVTVAHMEVPCCSGLVRIAEAALARSGKEIPLRRVRIGIRGGRRECND